MENELFNPPWYPYYPLDFNGSTANWRAEHIGAYQLLLNYQWINGSIPDDIDELITIAKTDKKVIAKVIIKFEKNADGLLKNRRMENIRAEQLEKSNKHRKGAIITNQKKRDKALSATLSDTHTGTLSDTLSTTHIDKDIDKELLSNDNNLTGEGKKEVKKTKKEEVVIPEPFASSPKFLQAWDSWLEMRKKKNFSRTADYQQTVIDHFAKELTVVQAIDGLNYLRDNRYQGYTFAIEKFKKTNTNGTEIRTGAAIIDDKVR